MNDDGGGGGGGGGGGRGGGGEGGGDDDDDDVSTGVKSHRSGHLDIKQFLKSHSDGTWLTCHICQKKFSESGCLKLHTSS